MEKAWAWPRMARPRRMVPPPSSASRTFGAARRRARGAPRDTAFRSFEEDAYGGDVQVKGETMADGVLGKGPVGK